MVEAGGADLARILATHCARRTPEGRGSPRDRREAVGERSFNPQRTADQQTTCDEVLPLVVTDSVRVLGNEYRIQVLIWPSIPASPPAAAPQPYTARRQKTSAGPSSCRRQSPATSAAACPVASIPPSMARTMPRTVGASRVGPLVLDAAPASVSSTNGGESTAIVALARRMPPRLFLRHVAASGRAALTNHTLRPRSL